MLRDVAEIQRAHDLLQVFVFREIDVDQTPGELPGARQAMLVLQWVLGREGGDIFHGKLAEIEDRALTAGYRLLNSVATEGRADAAAH